MGRDITRRGHQTNKAKTSITTSRQDNNATRPLPCTLVMCRDWNGDPCNPKAARLFGCSSALLVGQRAP